MKIVFAVVDVATLGASMLARKGAKTGAKAVVKITALEFAANATASIISCVGNKLELPLPITMLLSTLSGSYVGIKGSKWVFKTVDGRTFKLADEAIEGISKNLDEVAEGVGKAVEYASSAAQYQRLKDSLATEEIQSVIKTTEHGAERLMSRGFSPSEISNLKLSPDKIMTQGDGASVFVKNVADGKFNLIVESENGVVTALKNISQKSLNRLANNYGWK